MLWIMYYWYVKHKRLFSDLVRIMKIPNIKLISWRKTRLSIFWASFHNILLLFDKKREIYNRLNGLLDHTTLLLPFTPSEMTNAFDPHKYRAHQSGKLQTPLNPNIIFRDWFIMCRTNETRLIHIVITANNYAITLT